MTNPIKVDLTANHVYEHIDIPWGCHNNNPEAVYIDPVQKPSYKSMNLLVMNSACIIL